MRKLGWMLALIALGFLGCASDDGSDVGSSTANTEAGTEAEGDEVGGSSSDASGDQISEGDANTGADVEGPEVQDAVESVVCECSSANDCENGDLCVPAGDTGVCSPFPVQGLCWDDSQCPFGAQCKNVSVCPCGETCDFPHSPGKCTEGTGCCSSDEDCIGNEVCANAVCKPLVGSFCWRDGDCGAGEICVGESICPCGSDCVTDDVGGKCLPEGGDCCLTDLDCGVDAFCENNTCFNKVEPGSCWAQGDCAAGESCVGAKLGCNCLQSEGCDAPKKPGMCMGPLKCCEESSECEEGLSCVAGACRVDMEMLEAGACWADGNCTEGETCVGPVVCSCGSVCDMDESAGFCQEKQDPLSGCCVSDADCEGGVCFEGVCQPLPSFALGECWSDAFCGVGEKCVGAVSGCACDELEFCDLEAIPGKCEGKVVPECCSSDTDCPGQQCVQGVCKSAPDEGQCWSDSNCADDETCEGAKVCPCDAPCAEDPTTVDDVQGQCMVPGVEMEP